MPYIMHETKKNRLNESCVLREISKQIGKTILPTDKLTGWDGIVEETGMAFEVKCRSYNWDFFYRNGLILNEGKWNTLVSRSVSGLKTILVVQAVKEIRWVDVSKIPAAYLRYDKAACDRYSTPCDGPVVVISGVAFRKLETL